LGPAAHAGEPEPSASDGIRIEPDTVIDDVEAHRRGLEGDGEDDAVGRCMATGAGENPKIVKAG